MELTSCTKVKDPENADLLSESACTVTDIPGHGTIEAAIAEFAVPLNQNAADAVPGMPV